MNYRNDPRQRPPVMFDVNNWWTLSALLLTLWTGSAVADLAKPDCTAIGNWAKQFDERQTYAVTPAISLPTAVNTDQFTSLFGKPVDQWSKRDFGSFDQQFKACQGALFTTDRKLAKHLNVVRKQFFGHIARTVQDLARAGQEGTEAVAAISALPDSAQMNAVLESANAALAGEDINNALGGLPRGAVPPLRQLAKVYPKLMSTRATALSSRLAKRREALEQALEAERQAKQQAEERARQQAAQEQEAARNALAEATTQLEAISISADALPELERLAALGALAKLSSEETQTFRDALQAKRDTVDAIVKRERSAQMAEKIRKQLGTLRDFKIDRLDDMGTYWQMIGALARLASTPQNAEALAAAGFTDSDMRSFRERFDAAATRLLPDFEQRLQKISATPAGQQQLRTAVRDITGMQGGGETMRPFYAAVQQRAQSVDGAVRHAAEWFPIAHRLDALLIGGEVEQVSVRGLRPGMDESDTVTTVKRQWHYEKQPSLDLEKTYGPGRAAAPQLKQERRNGGAITFKAMHDAVGQIDFIEHYRAKLEIDVVRDWLTKHFGKPDAEEPTGFGINWRWDDDQHLQIAAENQVDVFAASANYRSRLRVALWNDDYEDYLVEASERCDKIRKTPRSEMSMDDSMFFMKANCSLVAGHPLTPGLDRE